MRFYVFTNKEEAKAAEKFISDLAGCPFNDGVNARTGKPFKPHPEGKTNNYRRRPKEGTECWATIRERRDGNFFFVIPEGRKALGRFANIPLLSTNDFQYTIEEYSDDWNLPAPPPIPETDEERAAAKADDERRRTEVNENGGTF